jgi:hypothetical protein
MLMRPLRVETDAEAVVEVRVDVGGCGALHTAARLGLASVADDIMWTCDVVRGESRDDGAHDAASGHHRPGVHTLAAQVGAGGEPREGGA